MSDWIHSLPVGWMAIVIFGGTYLVTAGIYTLVMALATHIWFFASLLARTRVGLLELEGGKDWAREVALADAPRDTVAAHG